MNILFDTIHPRWGGLGNGGGSKTIVESTKMLNKQGHFAKILCNINNYTFTKIDKHFDIVKSTSLIDWKGFDVIVSVAACNLRHVMKMPIKKKFYWMRGVEKWQFSDGKKELYKEIKRFAKKGGKVLVNATHLKERLQSIGVDSTVCYSGLDEWESHFDNPKSPYVIGGCKYDRHKTKNSGIIREYANNPMNIKQNKNNRQLNKYYGSCDLWIAPSKLEGFHQSPAEAALSGCYIIGYDCPTNGTSDYLTEETGALYKTEEELQYHLKNPDFTKVKKMQEVLKNKIGSRSDCMKQMIRVLK